jgi:hypothetical protein
VDLVNLAGLVGLGIVFILFAGVAIVFILFAGVAIVFVVFVVVFCVAGTWLLVDKFARALCWFPPLVAAAFAILLIRGAVARVYLGGDCNLVELALVSLIGVAGIGAMFSFFFGWRDPGAIGLT